jgi:hypothetical protein
MCQATNGQRLTNKDQVLLRWKSSKEEPPTNQETPKKNYVIIDLPNRDEIVEAMKYLKDNKAAGSYSIAAELLKSGEPSLVNALNEMIQQVWIGETLSELSERVLCSVCKKEDKLDCKNYRGIFLLNVAYAYNVYAKVLHSRLLPYANAVVQNYQTEYQSSKSTTDQLFALR